MTEPNQNPFAANPFSTTANPFGATSAVETSYTAPASGAWGERPAAQQPDDEYDEDEPFTAAHLAAAQAAAVPAVSPPPQAAPQPLQPLAFTASTQPTPGQLTGRVGAPVPGATGGGGGRGSPPLSPVPRVGSAPATASLLAGPPSFTAPAAAAAGAAEPQEDPSRYPFYSIKRYRTYFNVDTWVRLWWWRRGCWRGGSTGRHRIARTGAANARARRSGLPGRAAAHLRLHSTVLQG